MYGGFVKWEKGDRQDGSDSVAVQVRRTLVTIVFFYLNCVFYFFFLTFDL